jgi:hypothetical protein
MVMVRRSPGTLAVLALALFLPACGAQKEPEPKVAPGAARDTRLKGPEIESNGRSMK